MFLQIMSTPELEVCSALGTQLKKGIVKTRGILK